MGFFAALVLLSSPLTAAHAQKKSTGVPEYDRAVAKAAGFIKSQGDKIRPGEAALVAYALLKAGEPKSSTLVQRGLDAAIKRGQDGYKGYTHAYNCGVDALLLADVDPVGHADLLQAIANHLADKQTPTGGWSGNPYGEHPEKDEADTSMAAYAMLGLWAARNANATISLEVVERHVDWQLKYVAGSGGGVYHPEVTPKGPESHNLTMAAATSLGLGRLLLFGPRENREDSGEVKLRFGVLEEVQSDPLGNSVHIPRVSTGQIDSRLGRAFGWINARYPPPFEVDFPHYFFYMLERAATLHGLGEVQGNDWYRTYGDLLLSRQTDSGSFSGTSNRLSTDTVRCCFAILYFMRATKQTLDRQWGTGRLTGDRGLGNIFGRPQKKDIGAIDELLQKLTEGQDFTSLDVNPEELVEEIQYGTRDELVGKVDLLKKLVKSTDFRKRQVAYWALGRTSDFELIPLLIEGIRDPSVDVNVQAIDALRYVSRKPKGFGLTLNPMKGVDREDNEKWVGTANVWRGRAWRAWIDWYSRVRPYEEAGGLDELLAPE